MRCLFEIYRTLDEDARIHCEALERGGQLQMPYSPPVAASRRWSATTSR
jgi:hypothetical protein